MKENKFTNYKLVTKFICGKDKGTQFISFDELMETNNIESVDFLKIDIEVSEFGLFNQSQRLNDVKNIAMEVHLDEGNPQEIIDVFVKNGFIVNAVHRLFEETTNAMEIEFIYLKYWIEINPSQ